MNPRIEILLGVLPLLVAVQESAPGPRLDFEGDPRPAYLLGPQAPNAILEGRPSAPQNGRIERNGQVSDRFEEEGQSVDYAFEAEAGELSLFELSTLAYERGAQAVSVLRVLDAQGRELRRSQQKGGEAFSDFFDFVAPATGGYSLQLVAQNRFFRYSLVRHSDFHSHVAGAVYAIGERERLFDYLRAPEEELRYALDLQEGEELCLRALNLGSPARLAARLERRAALLEPDEGGMMGMDSGRGKGAGMMAAPRGKSRKADRKRGSAREVAPRSEAPRLSLSLWKDGERVATAPGDLAHFLSWRVPASGIHELRVTAKGGADSRDEGGIFELEVRRDLAKVPVSGSVADGEGEGLRGMLLRFLLEPELDPVALLRSGQGGEWGGDLPEGEYLVLVMPPGPGSRHPLRTVIDGARALHVVYDPR
jgi:hypothetical protein